MSERSDQGIRALTRRRRESPNGAGHYHISDLYKNRVSVSIQGIEVASSCSTVILKEVGKSVYNPVFYFPKADVNLNLLEAVTGYSTFCPIKGDASYWNFIGGTNAIEKAAWSYETPLEYSGMIEEHLGFDQRYATIQIHPSS